MRILIMQLMNTTKPKRRQVSVYLLSDVGFKVDYCIKPANSHFELHVINSHDNRQNCKFVARRRCKCIFNSIPISSFKGRNLVLVVSIRGRCLYI